MAPAAKGAVDGPEPRGATACLTPADRDERKQTKAQHRTIVALPGIKRDHMEIDGALMT
jgi:hypothetical protein